MKEREKSGRTEKEFGNEVKEYIWIGKYTIYVLLCTYRSIELGKQHNNTIIQG